MLQLGMRCTNLLAVTAGGSRRSTVGDISRRHDTTYLSQNLRRIPMRIGHPWVPFTTYQCLQCGRLPGEETGRFHAIEGSLDWYLPQERIAVYSALQLAQSNHEIPVSISKR